MNDLTRLLRKRMQLSEIRNVWFLVFGTRLEDDFPGRDLAESVAELCLRAEGRKLLEKLRTEIVREREDLADDMAALGWRSNPASGGSPGAQNVRVNAPTGQVLIVQNLYGNVTAEGAETPGHREGSVERGGIAMSDAGSYRYDAFISYRREEPDKSFARRLLKDLEGCGYRIAIDERDFAANQPFLTEMERCVKESRFTLAVVSRRYFESGNCEEEAVICKVLDMGERKRRLVPLTVEKVTMPTWMYGLTGVRFDDPDPLVPPMEKVVETLGNPR